MSNPSSGWIEKILNKPHLIFSFLALFVFAGILGYQKSHQNLFPNSNYPEVAIVITQAGASAKSIASNVAVVVEEELYSLDEIRRAYSNTIDEVTVIRAEFEYSKDINAALNDVSNALFKIRKKLPEEIQEPQVMKITETTAPILIVSVSSQQQNISLEDIRDLGSTDIKHTLLKTEGVSNVDVFGGYQKELHILIDKMKLDQLNLSLSTVLNAIQKNDKDYAIGFISDENHRYLLKSQGKKESVAKLQNIPINTDIKLSDIAKIYFGHNENSAMYYGNGKKAIALSIQRSSTADVVTTIQNCETVLASLKEKYPALHFEISDTQKETISQSTENMFEALRDAIIMSTIVVFLFLASFRQILVVLGTIPLVYASTIALMWLFHIDFNVVTLTAIILALGLLLDDTVVVMENIERHYKELNKEIQQAVIEGTKEIMFADLSGTVTTMIALFPMLFVGGYPETIFAPLVGTLLLALSASYIISIIVVPLLSLYILDIKSPMILAFEKRFHHFSQRMNETIENIFSSLVLYALNNIKVGIAYFLVLFILFFTSIKFVMPTVGQELMPPMDTGVINLKITTDANLPIERSEAILTQINTILAKKGNLLRSSASIGSEADVLSVGSGGSINHISIIATYVDRYQRDESIWDIAKNLRIALDKIPYIRYSDVSPFGATALSSIRANINTMISASDLTSLQDTGKIVEEAMSHTKGIVSIAKTWDMDKKTFDLMIDEPLLAKYGISKSELIKQLQILLRGSIVSSLEKNNAIDYPVRVIFQKNQIDTIDKIVSMQINTPKGNVPLNQVATLYEINEPTNITREGLNYTLEIYGNREKGAISHIMDNLKTNLQNMNIDKEVEIEQIGDMKQFLAAAERMINAILIAIVLIFFILVIMFNSIKVSLMIIFSIPLTIIGASWTMLSLDYHTSMPAMMGFILLSGIIVNNAILLIHFALNEMKNGANKIDAMLQAIKIRTRPVLMTAFSVSVGMLPVAQGAAIGLERLSPLGAVAIGGLIVGTLMTLVFIPIVFVWTIKTDS